MPVEKNRPMHACRRGGVSLAEAFDATALSALIDRVGWSPMFDPDPSQTRLMHARRMRCADRPMSSYISRRQALR
jgi:hypothetical protein